MNRAEASEALASLPRTRKRVALHGARSRRLWIGIVLSVVAGPGCSELRGRYVARQGNHAYQSGEYTDAVRLYTQAEQYIPDLPALVLNKGLACRQLVLPGSKSTEATEAVRCALSAFEHLKALRPTDARGDQLYVQTLFDADRFDDLVQMYRAQHEAKPQELGPVNGMIQVYSRSGNWEELLKWSEKRAEMGGNDADSHYTVGVLIWNRLFTKGGGPDRAVYDPRPEAKQTAPVSIEGDIVGFARVELADRGLKFLEKALQLRPAYREAVIYLNLLERQKAYGYFEQPEQWYQAITRAETWRQKAVEMAGGSVSPVSAASGETAAPAPAEAAAAGETVVPAGTATGETATPGAAAGKKTSKKAKTKTSRKKGGAH